jgi:hypothetical protein
MAFNSYTHDATLVAELERDHTTAHEKGSLFSRAEAVGRELARYGLVAVVGVTELEALQEIDSEVRRLGARIVALTPELERYTRTSA